MTVLERRKILKRQIDLSDENTLEKIEKVLNSAKMIFPDFVLSDIEDAKSQINNGDCLSEEEAEKEFEEWLNEK